VWSCSCDAPIRDIVISRQGVVGVVAASSIYLYAGAPSFGQPHSLSLSPARLTAYEFSADGTHFLTGDSQGFVKWWEVHTGEESSKAPFPFIKNVQNGSQEDMLISSIVCHLETDLIAVAAGNTLCIFGEGGLRLHSIGPLDSVIRSIQWNKSNELAVNVGTAICMIHVTREHYIPRQKYPSELKEGEMKTLACSPKGNMFAAGCTTRLVQIWDLASESNEQISVFVKSLPNAATADGSVQCLEWDASARFLAAAGGSDVIVWDMQDTNENEEGKDTSIVCYGHAQKAKITALSFQPKGRLLATGGDDCQVLVFDSSSFTSSGVVGGLVDSIVGGRVTQSHSGSAITALAWHPSGLILAGTTSGHVDAFEVSGAIYETPKATNSHATDMPFLITRVDPRKRANQPKPSGWGGTTLIPNRADGVIDKTFARRRGPPGTMGAGTRSVGSKPKVYLGNFKQNPRPFIDNTGSGANGNWPTMMHPPSMMPWPAYSPQHAPPHFAARPPASAASPYADPPINPPHTPESNSSEGVPRGAPPNAQAPHRNENAINRSGSVEQPPHLMPGLPPHPMGYMPYPAPFPMGYSPHAYGYPFQMHPHVHAEGMHGPMPGYGAPHFGHPPINQPPKAPQLQHSASSKTDQTHKDGSPELEEDLGSKSSEATNNGVNNNVTPTQHSEASGFYQEGRQPQGQPQPQGQTLYVGNLAPGVEENILMQYFALYGPVSSVQVIRDRETQMSRGYGFVTFVHPFYAQVAMQHMDSVQIMGPFEGKKLKVSFSNRR